MQPTNNVRDAIVVIGATGGGTVVSLIPQIEAWLRLASVTVGLIVGVIILLKQIRHWNKEP